jgi:hypothetical protein
MGLGPGGDSQLSQEAFLCRLDTNSNLTDVFCLNGTAWFPEGLIPSKLCVASRCESYHPADLLLEIALVSELRHGETGQRGVQDRLGHDHKLAGILFVGVRESYEKFVLDHFRMHR